MKHSFEITKTTTLKEVPKGDTFIFPNKKTVYVKGEYDRSYKRYTFTKWLDVNDFRILKGSTVVCLVDVDY